MPPSTYSPSQNVLTWDTIANRLTEFTPSIQLGDYIDFEAQKTIKVSEYTSEGVTFSISKENRDKLLGELREARTFTNRKGFEEGRWQGALHAAKGALKDLTSNFAGKPPADSWTMNISYKSTKGIGFRQIWYLELTDRQQRMKQAWAPRLEKPPLDPRFTGLFSAPNESIDLTSLHVALPDIDPDTNRAAECNIHIDQVGINADLGLGPAATPDMAYHTLVELLFRTGLKGILPDHVLQNVDFIMPSSHENYALNFGAQYTPIKTKDVRLSFRGTCGKGEHGWGCAATVNLGGRFNWLGSK